jgi:hypothetical protein
VFIFVLVAASVWIQVSRASRPEDATKEESSTAATGQNVPAKEENRSLDAILSEIFGPPIPYRDIMNEEVRELRKSRNPTNSATQNIYVEQFLFIGLPADVPHAHKVSKRVLPEFT